MIDKVIKDEDVDVVLDLRAEAPQFSHNEDAKRIQIPLTEPNQVEFLQKKHFS